MDKDIFVFIDDNSYSGTNTGSEFLDSVARWVAILIYPEIKPFISNEVAQIRQRYNIYEEFHFTEIFQGKKKFASISPSQRFSIIYEFVDILIRYNIPILVQSFSDKQLSGLNSRGLSIPFFNLKKNTDFALLYLISTSLPEQLKKRKRIAHLFCDEGFKKKGTILKFGSIYDDVYHRSELKFISSSENEFMQIADCAAFLIGRTQWNTVKDLRTTPSLDFITKLRLGEWNMINLSTTQMDPSKSLLSQYEIYHNRHKRTQLFKELIKRLRS